MNRCAICEHEFSNDHNEKIIELFEQHCRPATDLTEGVFARLCNGCFNEHDILEKHEKTPEPPVTANFREREAYRREIQDIWGDQFLERIDLEAITVV